MNGTGPLDFDVLIRNTDFKKSFDEMERRVAGFTQKADQQINSLEETFSNLGRVAAGAFAFTQLAQLPQKLIQVRGEFQQLEIAFTTMLGNKAKSDALFADVVKLAATTPFDLKQVAGGAKQLLAYGVASEDVTKTLTRLGDIAAGLSIPLQDLTYVYGTTKTQGRLFAADLNQFVGRGIPLIKLLADQFGVAESEVKNLVEQGKVGFPEVEKAINKLTDAGGIFSGLMAEQSKSLTGLYANFEDAVEQAFNKVGKQQEGLLGDSIKFATAMVENYEPILDVLKVLVATYGTYKAAIIATAAVQSIAANAGLIKTFFNLAGSIKSAADAQALFNLVTGLNPYVAAAAALVGLITAVALFRDTTTEAEKAQARIADVNTKVTDSLAGELGKIELLTAQIKNENVSRADRNKKLQELISIHPQILSGITLENIATENGTKAINNYIEARKRQIEVEQLKVELDESIKRGLDAKNGKNDTSFLSDLGSSMATMGSGFTAGTKGTDYLKVQAAERKKLNSEIAKEEADFQKSILARVTALQTADAASNKSAENTEKNVKKTVAAYDQDIKAKKDAQESATSNAEYKRLQAEIDAIEQKKARITGALTKNSKALAKEAEKSGPYGSAAYWDYIASKAREILEKTPVDQTGKISSQTKVLADAERNAQAARKKISVLSFDEELEEKKKQYSQYQQWVDNLGSKAANQQFDGLITQGKSYAEYLKTQIDNFQSVHPDSLTGQEQDKLVKLKIEYSDATDAEKPMEKFQKRLDDARSSATSLTDEIEKLKKIQSELSQTDFSPEGIAKRKSTQEQLNEATNERKKQLQQYLSAIAGTEERRLEIENRYRDLGVELEKKYGTDRGSAYQAAVSAMNKDKKKEIDTDNVNLASQSTEFKALTRLIEESSNEQTGIKLDAAKKQLAILKAKNLEETDEYKDQLFKIRQLEKENADKRTAIYDMLGQSLASIGEALSGIDGILGNAGALLSSVGSGVGSVSKALDKFKANKDAGGDIGFDQYAQAAQGAIQLIDMAISSARERKKAEQEYYNSVIAQQKQYNQLLVEQIGLRYEADSNVFVTDQVAKIQSGIAQLNAAQLEYEKSLDALQDGRAKLGQKDKVDWGKVGSGAVTGAAAGAAFGPIGAVVGGAVGALVGLFSGKKKKDQYGGLLDVFPELIDQAGNFNKALAETLVANNLVDDKTKLLLQDTIAWTDQIAAAKDQINGVITDLAGSLGDDLRNALVGAFEDGTSAADAFGGAVSKILEDMVSQILFSQLFADDFDKLQKEMQASFDVNGDQSAVDDIIRFYQDAGQKAQSFNDSLAAAQELGKQYGLDLFTGDKNSNNADPLQGAIKGMSDETASIISGQMNAIRITQADSNSILRQQLLHQANISSNSNYLRYLLILDSIDQTLKSLKTADNFNRQYGG